MILMKHPSLIALCFAAVAWLGLAPNLRGTTIRSSSWEKLANDAEFVGVVTCTTSGGIVARYRVDDAWKGLQNGAEFLLRRPPDGFGDQFPVSLCGQQFLVTAFKFMPPAFAFSDFRAGNCPLWWRRIDADLTLPYLQGIALVENGRFMWGIDSGKPSVSEFKARITSFLSLPDQERERRLLVDAALEEWGFSVPSGKVSILELRAKLEKIADADAVVREILAIANTQPDKLTQAHLLRALVGGGGHQTLAILKTLKTGHRNITAGMIAHLIADLEEKLSQKNDTRALESENPPSSEAIKTAEQTLKKLPWDHEAIRALALMAKYAPAAAVSPLRDWTAPPDDKYKQAWGYYLGSIFCFSCVQDRDRHFVTLLDAKDDFVRVAAAVYLRKVNPETACRKLKEFTALEDDPGAWAALVLASAGDKSVIPRVLKTYLAPNRGSVTNRVNRLFQCRANVLLSNSASHSGIAPPALALLDSDQYHFDPRKTLYEPWLKWWKENEVRLKLHDPWLERLDAQGID